MARGAFADDNRRDKRGGVIGEKRVVLCAC
jgi:hypothetical protein